MDQKLTVVNGGKNADGGLFNKFKNKAWACQMISLLLIIDQDPVQMEHAEAALGALAELLKAGHRHLNVVD